MSVDGESDYLVIQHTAALALGKHNADFTVSFALIQTENQNNGFKNLIHKGNNDRERTPAIWKLPTNTGFHARISTTGSWNSGIDNSPAVKLNQWVYLTYLKKGQQLKLYYDGKVTD